MRNLAGELDIPILALAQLNRGADGYTKPRLSQIKGSGAFEEDADVVIFLWTEEDPTEMFDPENPKPYDVNLSLVKQRNGPLGEVKLQFTPWLTRFEEKA